ncbi:Uncharacterised protein [Arcanobacterium haemolyticum]|nr:Uncharacterised protein [Arcanobacterium haemolyticum]
MGASIVLDKTPDRESPGLQIFAATSGLRADRRSRVRCPRLRQGSRPVAAAPVALYWGDFRHFRLVTRHFPPSYRPSSLRFRHSPPSYRPSSPRFRPFPPSYRPFSPSCRLSSPRCRRPIGAQQDSSALYGTPVHSPAYLRTGENRDGNRCEQLESRKAQLRSAGHESWLIFAKIEQNVTIYFSPISLTHKFFTTFISYGNGPRNFA